MDWIDCRILNRALNLDPQIHWMELTSDNQLLCRTKRGEFLVTLDVELGLYGDIDCFTKTLLDGVEREHGRLFGPDQTAYVDLAAWRPVGYWCAYDD